MIFLSLGSNMSSKFGNRFETINLVTNMLSTSLHRSTTIKHSSFYETPSYPDQNNPKFINTIVSISFDLSNPFTKVDHIINTIFFIEKKSPITKSTLQSLVLLTRDFKASFSK